MIIIFRIIFLRSNKRRDNAFAEGRLEYDPSHVVIDDVSDWKNPSFRYIGELTLLMKVRHPDIPVHEQFEIANMYCGMPLAVGVWQFQ